MTLIAFLSFLAWVGLTVARHDFWRADRRIEATVVDGVDHDAWPSVLVAIPARDEADVIDLALSSHAAQRYPGRMTIVVADDHSTDDTKARAAAVTVQDEDVTLQVVDAPELPSGWTGKLWAQKTALDAARKAAPDARFALLCDADIAFDPGALRALVAKAEAEERDIVSLMAKLKTDGFWASLLMPAYVFFFQKLYPFPAVNDRARKTAAAAGGCALVRLSAFDEAGGFEAWRSALIDDCAMARAVKRRAGGPPYKAIWLGLTRSVRSLRAYDKLDAIWSLVTRTAFDQLGYSYAKLVGAVLAMALAYFAPPVAVIYGLAGGGFAPFFWGALAYALMMRAYAPTATLYDKPVWRGLELPLAAGMYVGMTADSAIQSARGEGGRWKGRNQARTAKSAETTTAETDAVPTEGAGENP